MGLKSAVVLQLRKKLIYLKLFILISWVRKVGLKGSAVVFCWKKGGFKICCCFLIEKSESEMIYFGFLSKKNEFKIIYCDFLSKKSGSKTICCSFLRDKSGSKFICSDFLSEKIGSKWSAVVSSGRNVGLKL